METRLGGASDSDSLYPEESLRTREGVPEHPGLNHPKLRAQRKPRRQLCSECVCCYRSRLSVKSTEISGMAGGAIACTEGVGCPESLGGQDFPPGRTRLGGS